MAVNIIITGVGGQGSVLASRIVAGALLQHAGSDPQYRVRVGETFGAAQRGGSVASHVRAGSVLGPLVGEDQADLIVALEPLEGLRIAVRYLKPGGTVVLNTRAVPPTDVKAGYAQYPALEAILEALDRLGGKVIALDATALAEEAGSIKAMNVVLVGAAARTGLTGVHRETFLQAVEDRVPARFKALNLKAFDLGWQCAGEAT
ncbi:MAG: indolepyruvate oxidoreductase subunit beta [Bacillota bacterium]